MSSEPPKVTKEKVEGDALKKHRKKKRKRKKKPAEKSKRPRLCLPSASELLSKASAKTPDFMEVLVENLKHKVVEEAVLKQVDHTEETGKTEREVAEILEENEKRKMEEQEARNRRNETVARWKKHKHKKYPPENDGLNYFGRKSLFKFH